MIKNLYKGILNQLPVFIPDTFRQLIEVPDDVVGDVCVDGGRDPLPRMYASVHPHTDIVRITVRNLEDLAQSKERRKHINISSDAKWSQ